LTNRESISVMKGLIALAMLVALGGCRVGGTATPNYLNDINLLTGSVTSTLETKMKDPTSTIYQPDGYVKDAHCVNESERQFSCLLDLSDGSSVSPVVIVAADGQSWVSHAR
jgi:hypothetical protein